jgi:hypothetical protein
MLRRFPDRPRTRRRFTHLVARFSGYALDSRHPARTRVKDVYRCALPLSRSAPVTFVPANAWSGASTPGSIERKEPFKLSVRHLLLLPAVRGIGKLIRDLTAQCRDFEIALALTPAGGSLNES